MFRGAIVLLGLFAGPLAAQLAKLPQEFVPPQKYVEFKFNGNPEQMLAEFLKILLPSLGKLSGSKPRRVAAAPTNNDETPKRRNPHRISAYEVVCYTLALALAAAIASGWFDLMIPWSA